MSENLYTYLACKEQFSKALLTCPKCGFKTAAGRVQDYRDSLLPSKKQVLINLISKYKAVVHF